MHKALATIAIALLTATALPASESTDVMSTLNRFADAMNKGDAGAAKATCAPELSIIDDVPPHEWHGQGAFSRWLKDLGAFSEKNGITGIEVRLGKPRHLSVAGGTAYAVVPLKYVFVQHGKRTRPDAAILTCGLARSKAGWRITGWAWSRQ